MTAAREELERLAGRVESGDGTGHVALLREAFEAIHGPKPPRVAGGSAEWLVWLDRFNPFFAMLETRSFLDAAMTLIPANMLLHSLGETRHMKGGPWLAMLVEREQGAPHSGPHAAGATAALALAAAALRAQVASS